MKEYENAILYYKKEEDELGYCGVANCYYKLKNYENAFNYYHKAAKLNNSSAMLMLSKFYKKGLGCEKSVVNYLFWKQKYMISLFEKESN